MRPRDSGAPQRLMCTRGGSSGAVSHRDTEPELLPAQPPAAVLRLFVLRALNHSRLILWTNPNYAGKHRRASGLGFLPLFNPALRNPACFSSVILLASQSQHPEWEKDVESCFHFSFQLCFLPGRAVQRLCRQRLCSACNLRGGFTGPLRASSASATLPVQSPEPPALPLKVLSPQDYMQPSENSFVLYLPLYKTDTGGIYSFKVLPLIIFVKQIAVKNEQWVIFIQFL